MDQWLHNTRGIIVVVLMIATGALLLSIDPGNGFPQGASASSGGGGGDTSVTSTTVPTSTTTPLSTRPTLQEGTTDTADTTVLQQKLASLGYQVTADGSFGPGTKAAVIQFQTSKSLPATGVVDAATWTALGL
ncbi:MAG: peptidoglycan-binding domain-containing protein [Acidimicrobiia bacterium]